MPRVCSFLVEARKSNLPLTRFAPHTPINAQPQTPSDGIICAPTLMILPTETHASGGASLNLDLIRKYSIPGPRYTSYPTANQFTTALTSLALEDAITDDNRPGAGPVSLYFHLPFCETRCWFCGCNTIITDRKSTRLNS